MSRKKKCPCSVGALTEAKTKYIHKQYITEFTEKQAEAIWKRDMRLLVIGAVIVAALLLMGVGA